MENPRPKTKGTWESGSEKGVAAPSQRLDMPAPFPPPHWRVLSRAQPPERIVPRKNSARAGTGGQSIPTIHAQPGPPIERGIETSRDAAVLPGGAGLSRRSDISAPPPPQTLAGGSPGRRSPKRGGNHAEHHRVVWPRQPWHGVIIFWVPGKGVYVWAPGWRPGVCEHRARAGRPAPNQAGE